MSLGFLTESALVPSKAKAIKVDTNSLVDLRAVVFQKDQERKRRLQEALTAENDDDNSSGQGALRLGKYAHLRGAGKGRKRSSEERVGKKRRNTGVEARSRRDEEARQREAPAKDDDEAWSRKSAEMLQKKAKLYEEMANGGGNSQLKGEVLVDFEAKKFMCQGATTRVKTMVEITDEFGRSRAVATDSDEYSAFLDTQQREEHPACGGSGREGQLFVEDRAGDGNVEGGSFVASQWEKRLKATEKTHLKEVHARATLAQSFAHSSSSGAADRKTRKQLRVERLRKQREEAVASSESTAPPSAAVDPAASEKATDFLNQLSSLM
jgi:hypothetical protein